MLSRVNLRPHHFAWLMAHPERTSAWLIARILDGFHVHHLDANHDNNDPDNLVLMDGVDHMRMHGMPFSAMEMRKAQRSINGQKGGRARAEKLSPRRRKQIARKAAKKRWSTPKIVEVAPQ